MGAIVAAGRASTGQSSVRPQHPGHCGVTPQIASTACNLRQARHEFRPSTCDRRWLVGMSPGRGRRGQGRLRGQRPTLRELIVPFGSTGYVLRVDTRTPELILVIGARHQREEDFQ